MKAGRLCALLAPGDRKLADRVAHSGDPETALVRGLGKKRVGVIDWKWPMAEIVHALKPQLARWKLKPADWDWSLDPQWDEVATDGCLKAAGGFLAARGLVLAAIDFPADAHALLILDGKTFAAAQREGKAAGVRVFAWKGKAPTIAAVAPPARPVKVDKKKVPTAGYLSGSGGPWLVFCESDVTFWVDASRWPPRIVRQAISTGDAARRADGAWIAGPDRPEPGLRIQPRPGARPTAALTTEPEVRRFSVVGWVGGKALGIPSIYGVDGPSVPYVQRANKLVPAPGVKSTRSFNTRYGAGGGFVVWQGDGYELRGGALKRTFRLGATDVHPTLVPDGRDGFFYLDGGQLKEARRGERPVAHLADRPLTGIAPGPDGGILAWDILSRGGLIGTLYFPARGEEIQLSRRTFGVHEIKWLAWPERSNRLYIGFHARELWTVAGAAVLALPCTRTGEQGLR